MPILPVIKIPSFDGTRSEWLDFKTKFEALVHSRNDLSCFVKHTQLLNALTGSAKTKINEFTPGDDDYPKAWQALLDAYDHKRIMVFEHVDAILDLPTINSATSKNLTLVLDQAKQHLRMLERLKSKSNNEFVVRLIERALPQATKNRWHDTLELELQNNIFRLHAIESSQGNTRNNTNNKKRTNDRSENSQFKFAKKDAQSFATSSSGGSNVKCPRCRSRHHLFQCAVFYALSINDKWAFVKKNKLCRNCLGTDHFNASCKSGKRCKRCSKNHHTLLHEEHKPDSKSDGSSANTNVPSTSNSSRI